MAILASPGVRLTPSPSKVPTATNFLSGAYFDYTNQYLPDTEKIIYDPFGNQMITGMLERLGKESTLTSDNFKWTEDGRLTQLGQSVTRSGDVFTLANHSFRVGETMMVIATGGTATRQGRVSAVTTNDFTVICGDAAGWTAIGTTGITTYAYGSEFQKGTDGMAQSLNSQISFYEQIPVIIKEMVKENGSNLAQITWVDTGEGFLWYFKNYNDTEKRFKNKIESELIEGRLWTGSALATAGYQGTQGLLSAADEGNIFSGLIQDLNDVDEIVERMNAQGMFSQNYLYCTTPQRAATSDFIKAENVTGLSWGAFDNDEKKAFSLNFDGFKRSGYEFYTSTWRYLEDPTQRGAITGASKVHALMIPSASAQVYDVTAGGKTSATLPMLHVKYRASQLADRKMQLSVRDFTSGTSGGNDSLTTDFLTERMLVLIGRNNVVKAAG